MQPNILENSPELVIAALVIGWAVATMLLWTWLRTERALFKAYDALNRAEYSTLQTANSIALQKRLMDCTEKALTTISRKKQSLT